MSSDGTFKNHINTAIHTANHLCGWTLRTFYSRHRQPMLMLTLICPKARLLLPAMEPKQNRRYPGTGTSAKKLHQEDPRNPTPVILGTTEGDIFVLSGKKTGTLPGYLPVANTRRPGSQFQWHRQWNQKSLASEKRTLLPSPPYRQKWHHSSSELASRKFCCTCSSAVQLPARLH